MELLQAKIKDRFTITVGGEHVVSTSPLLAFGEYEIVTSIAHISDNNIFSTYDEAKERIEYLFHSHRLLRTTTNPANRLKIVPIRTVEAPQILEK